MTSRTVAAIYCRISRDPEGLRCGVERQEEDCRALAKRANLRVGPVYIDNDISASTLSKKKRPQYDAMLTAARAGEFGVILAYSNSRLTRRLQDLEGLIQLHEQHGVRIKTVVSGEDNLSTADGRMVARIKASVDSAEAERAGERIRRAHLQRARNGTTNHGGRPFGWAADKLALDPVEAALIRQAADQVLAGVPLRVIAREWSARGVKTSRGSQFTHTTLRRLLRRPRLVGIRVYQGQVLLDDVGEPVRGEWEPILDPDTYARLVAFLDADGRAGARKGARRYLLSGVMRCGTCGGRMTGMKTPKSYAYTCQPEPMDHSVTIAGPATDEAILSLVEARLSEEELAAPEPAPDAVAETRLARIPDMIGELMTAYNSGQLSASIVFPQVEALEQERAQIQSERAHQLRSSVAPPPVTADALRGLDVDRQRAVIGFVLDAVFVAPAERRGAPWTTDRLTPVWRTA